MTEFLVKLINNKEYDKALDICQQRVCISNEDIAKKLSNESNIYYLKKEYDLAIKTAEEASSYLPEWYKPYYRLAKSYEAIGDYDQMNNYYNKMFLLLKSEEKEKTLLHMQDYYNKDINFLRHWITRSGGYISDEIIVQYYDVDYRGAIVNKKIKKNVPLIKIPFKCGISLEDSKLTNPYNIILLKSGYNYNSHTYLAIELLRIKNSKDERSIYVRCFPKYFDNVPINFKIIELQQLKGSYAIAKIFQKLYSLNLEYNNILESIPNFPYTFKEFCWARTAIITRIYAIERNGVTDNVSMPFADMANHQTPPNTSWGFNNDSQEFIVSTDQDIYPNTEIYETYGYKSNYRYFVNYGFTVKNNDHELAAIQFNPLIKLLFDNYIDNLLNNESPFECIADIFQKKYIDIKNILEKLFNNVVFEVGYVYNDDVIKMLDHLRNSKEITEKQKEIEIHNNIINTINQTLSTFVEVKPFSSEFIDIQLSEFNQYNIQIMKENEKKVLLFWIDFSTACIELLNNNDPKKIKKYNKKMNKYSKYISTFNKYVAQLLKL